MNCKCEDLEEVTNEWQSKCKNPKERGDGGQ